MAKEKEWSPKYSFCPRRSQFTGGVRVVLDPGKEIMTAQGQFTTGASYKDITFGGDQKGTMASSEKEEKRLLELAKDPKTDICLFADRQAPAAIKSAEAEANKERARADAATAELEALKAKMAKQGV